MVSTSSCRSSLAIRSSCCIHSSLLACWIAYVSRPVIFVLHRVRSISRRSTIEGYAGTTYSESMMTLVEAESLSDSIDTLSRSAWCCSRGGGTGSAAAPAAPAGSVTSSTPTAPSLLYLLGDISVVAGPIPMGVLMKLTDSVLGRIGVDSSSMSSSAAEPPVLLDRMNRPLLLLLDLSICCRACSQATDCLGRAPINTGKLSSMDCDLSIVMKSLYTKPVNAKDINITLPIGASIYKTRSKLETTEQLEVSQFYSIQSIKNYFYLYNSDSLPEMRFHLTASFTGPR